MARRVAPPSYIHVIADDESPSAQPSPKRWRRSDTPVDRDWPASSISSPPPKMVCCCFSTSPMPRCCLVAASSSTPSSAAASPPSEELRAFCTAARVTRRIGTALIQRQAAAINRQLLSQPLWSAPEEAPPTAKRRRHALEETTSPYHRASSLAHPDSPSASVASGVSTVTANSSFHRTPQENASRIWQQVDRMKRMALFLKNAQLAQSLLLEEMKECFLQEEEEAATAEFGGSESLPFPEEEPMNHYSSHPQENEENDG